MKRQILKYTWFLLWGGAAVWGGLINGYLGIHAACGDCVPPVAVLNHFAHWVTLAATAVFVFIVPVLVFMKRSRRLKWLMAVWLLPGVIAFGLWYGPAFLPRPAPDVVGVEFTAATYNVMGFGADAAKTFAVIQDMKADLVALEELRPVLNDRLQTELADEYPYQISRVVQGLDGYALLSRYPILDYHIGLDENSDYRGDTPRYVRALIDFDGQVVVVYVFHPTIPDLPPRLYFPTAYNDEILWRQVKGLVNLIRAEDAPVLVLCDCNSTPRSRQYALLNRYLDEVYGERGWGFGLTFPADRPMIRIDYIWHSNDFETLEAKVWLEGGTSDHRPLWASLILKKDDS
ncbi:MAG: endonuclease/exonuclease/phosphatase family protein [Chloroflexi bacterium]|nr:endonuclease/exonuclease/phosphatase family protein [Chloroflexota bacterium]